MKTPFQTGILFNGDLLRRWKTRPKGFYNFSLPHNVFAQYLLKITDPSHLNTGYKDTF